MKVLLFLFALLAVHFGKAQLTGHVAYAEEGVSFDIPKNWVGQELEEAFLMASSKEAGLVILLFHPANTLEEQSSKMKHGLSDGAISLSLEGKLSNNGKDTVEGHYIGSLEGKSVKAKLIAMTNPYGLGVAVLSLINGNLYSKRTDELAQEIAKSIGFKQPSTKISAVGNQSKNTQAAQEELVGYKLTYMESYYSNTPGGGGYERKRIINLCPNGLFTFYGGSYLNFPDPNWDPYQKNAKGHGTYEILEDDGDIYLQLNYNDGEYESLKCTYNDGVYLNGGRYYRGDVECY